MFVFAAVLFDRLRGFLREEAAQDAFEYVLVIGVIVAGTLIAFTAAPDLVGAVIDAACGAVKTLPQMTGITAC